MLKRVSDKTAYILVIAMCCLMIVGYSGFDNAAGSLYSFYTKNLRVNSSLYHTVNAVLGVLSSMWIKTIVKKLDRINLRFWMIAGNIIGLISGLLLNIVHNIVLFFVLSIIRKIVMFAFSSVMVTIAIVNWFKDRTGAVTSGVMICSGLGGIIMSKIYSVTIEKYGYLFSACLNMVIIFTLMIPCALFLSVKPEDVGKKPYTSAVVTEEKEVLNYNLDYKKGSRIFLAIAFTCASAIILVNINTFLPSLFIQKGYAIEQANLATTYCMVGNVMSKILFCVFVDKIGVRRMCTIMLIVATTGLALTLLINQPSELLLKIFLIMYGAGCSVTAIGISLFVKTAYAKEYFAEAYSLVALYDNIVSNLVTIATSFVYDNCGNYVVSFGVAATFGLMAIFMINIVMYRLKDDAPQGMIQ